MTIQYIEPLSRAIARTRKDLFNPFDMKKWFVIGFTAFLAGLTDFGVFGPPSSNWRRKSNVGIDDIFRFPQRAWEWFGQHPGWVIGIGVVVLCLFVIGTILTWLSSRGKFMFIDNLARGQAQVVKPWHEYKKEGNSLFLWSFVLGIGTFAVTIGYLCYCFMNLKELYQSSGDPRVLIIPTALAVFGVLVIALASALLFLALRDFIVPIMYRDRTPASKAIQKFLPLLFSEFIYFVGYALFVFCLLVIIVAAIIIAGCITCCIGFIILGIPYISAVIMLPISYTLRAFSVEFLEQFGRGFNIFPKAELNPPETQPVIG